MLTGKNPEPRKQIKKILPFNYEVEEYLPLPKAELDLKIPFFQVVNNRKSERIFSKLSLKKLSNLLWHCSKVKSIAITKGNQILTYRNSPSAGAIHPIDIFVSLPGNLERRFFYYYDPFAHKLSRLKLDETKLLLFFRNINNNLNTQNSTLIWFGANITRTKSKYKNPESLIWRDAGALIMLFQLVATALTIKSCPVGTLGNPFFHSLFPQKNNIVSGGGMLLG